MKVPMREKYVDERLGVWFIFGEYPDGNVDVSDGQEDIFTGIPRAHAERLVALHDTFRLSVYELLCKGAAP